MRQETRRLRLVAAIRRQTVEAPNDQPNGPTERALGELFDALAANDGEGAGDAAGRLANAMADDCQELREAAEGYFGGDFRKP
jgi:hypothetical protein